jgi:prolyl oligopeptidase
MQREEMKRLVIVLLTQLLLLPLVFAQEGDPFQWLEEITGERSIAWVKQHNAQTTKDLESVAEYQPIFSRVQGILDNKDRIPYVSFQGQFVYNFWKDAEHQRGIWRRTTLESYRTAKPNWDTIIDVDRLAKVEGKPWAWGGADCLEPAYRRCLVFLSPGGSDAKVVREFDTHSRSFVKDGFTLPEAKSRVDWLDADTLAVGTDFGAGSLTTSGYPRLVKLWRRGSPLATAQLIFEGQVSDVSANSNIIRDIPQGRSYQLVQRNIAFWKTESFIRLGDRLVKLDMPLDVELQGMFKEHMLLSLRSDWAIEGNTYKAGALIAIKLDAFLAGSRKFEVLFEPTERVSFGDVTSTGKRVMLLTMDNVTSRMYSLRLDDGNWSKTEVSLPGKGSATFNSVDRARDQVTYTYTDFLTPPSVYLDDSQKTEVLKASPQFFDAAGVAVEQLEAVSRDGTRIPYFVVKPRGFVANGKAPALLYGYGGFEVSQLPRYSAATGAAWIERGGVYILANIRGGGEFGPKWHQAVQGHAHMKNFEDFIAVAEDLQRRNITDKNHLGIMGGSQGGLLVGGSMALRPDLFKAVVSAVPLADMKRFHKLLAGASWMAEYGNPDKPEDWEVIKTWSPYELLNKETKYPKAFFWTTTRDDRVHPAHARKMVAKMEDMGHPVFYFENMEGGHGSGTTSKQQSQVLALQYAYLWQMLR